VELRCQSGELVLSLAQPVVTGLELPHSGGSPQILGGLSREALGDQRVVDRARSRVPVTEHDCLSALQHDGCFQGLAGGQAGVCGQAAQAGQTGDPSHDRPPVVLVRLQAHHRMDHLQRPGAGSRGPRTMSRTCLVV
jgi:hypothetical protein